MPRKSTSRRTPRPGRDRMPRTRKALINALHAWCEMRVEAGDVTWFSMKTILWMHKGPGPLPCRPLPTVVLQRLWWDMAYIETGRTAEPAE